MNAQERERPDPQALLSEVEHEHKGSLKIFFGASPGVAEGSARVIYSADQIGEVREGEVLIAPFNDVDATAAIVERHHDELAAVIVEPVQGEGGYVIPDSAFLPRLRRICDRHGILLVADEIQSGAGRTGQMWAIQHLDVEPDILLTAKGIGPGLPISAMVARAEIMDWPAGAHGSTFGGNPIACAFAPASQVCGRFRVEIG